MDFLESEAEESDGEHSEEEMEVSTNIKKAKKMHKIESDDDDDEEDDGEEVKDLIDDAPIEDEESDNESDGSRKRKKSDDDDSDDRLSDEDYDLLEENLGVKVQRKKFKRLKRIAEDSDDDQAQDGPDDRDVIANQLFEGSDNEEERPQPVEQSTHYGSEESDGEYSETDDFIVDDEGRPLTEKRKKRKPIFTDTSLQEAQDIFGVDFDYDEFEKYDEEDYEDEEAEDDEYEDEEQRTARKSKQTPRRRRKPKSIYEIYEPSELARAGFTDEDHRIRTTDIPERMQLRTVPVTAAGDEELDEEAEWIYDVAFKKPDPKAQATAADAGKTIVGDGFLAPSIISAPTGIEDDDDDWDVGGVSKKSSQAPPQTVIPDEDEDWDADAQPNGPAPKVPVVVSQPVVATAPVVDDDDEDWDAPGGGTSTSKADKGEDKEVDSVKAKTIPKIRKSLEFMRNQHLEVPFIALYRKEYVQPELANMNDLWTIYRLDAKFCQLRSRKAKLLTLFQNMQEYQTDLIIENDALPENVRVITEDDLERVKTIKNPEEFKDMYMQFALYYSTEVTTMKEALEKKKKEKRAKAKEKSSNPENQDGENGSAAPEETEEPEQPVEPEEPEEKDMTIKRNLGGGTYGFCRKLGLDGLAKKFGLTPEKFAENLTVNYQRHEIDQFPVGPLEAALDYITPRLSDAEEVLKAAKFMVATQISRDPVVRKTVRAVFYERALLSVTPTKKGFKEIDESHPVYRMKYLKGKPVRDLVGEQFLRLKIAEDDKLIKITLGDKLKGMTTESYVDEVKQLYIKDEFNKNVQEWNNLRAECVEFALEKLLFPVLRNELKAKLLEAAKKHILEACALKLHQWLQVAPYHVAFPDEEDEEWDTSKGIRVLSIAYVPDYEQAAFACVVNSDGEPLDYVRLQNITKYKDAFKESDRQEKAADLLAIKNFIRQKKPHIIVIGGESREAQIIQEDLRCVVSDLCGEDAFPSINVEILDNQQSKIYANSIKAATDFREYPLLLREAVSLGRRMQDPLIEYSQLCNADDEILCLKFHSLQDHLAKDDLLEYLQLEFVNQTNEVGVDVNRAISCPYSAHLVQFVCGLGVRKAAALIKTLKQNNQRLENRTQLITVCHMGPKIFINCSGFIKIDTNSLGDSTEAYVEVLDGSRVHPETYEWARKMAVDALEYDDEDANPAGALEEILETPERLKDLDLDAFAEELERQGFGDKSITLYDIRAELNHRYLDLRIEFEVPGHEELFNMLTKETPETLYIGKLVTANVVGISHKKPQGEQLDNAIPMRNEDTGMWQCAFCMKNDFPDLSEVWNHFDANACPGQATGVRVRLDNGIGGFIPIAKLSDKPVTNPESRVKRGQTIHCRITKIETERFYVECTSRTSDLVDAKHEWKPAKDPYYDQETEDKELKKEEETKKVKLKQAYVKRVIVHPSFKNISYRESEKLMEQMDQGEVIVRPSSKGQDHLTVTWKVSDGVYQHIDVREEGKENAFSLGQSLWIGNEEFEDLDEIIARFVNPMASHAREILNFKYYKQVSGGNRQIAEEYLMDEKRKSANKIHYMIYAAKEYPGKFLISYLPRHNVHHEFITITPEGFRFRQMTFDSLNHVLKWFKEHYNEAPPSMQVGVGITPNPAAAVRTPFTTPGLIPGGPGDAAARMGGAPSIYGAMSQIGAHPRTTPHFTTPGQNYTPYSSFTSHTPYTPTAQTPFMTPFQGNATPRFPQQMGSANNSFAHPGATTPGGYKTPQQQRFSQTPKVGGNAGNENLDWRRAAEAWAKSQQRGPAGSMRGGPGGGGPSGSRAGGITPGGHRTASRDAAQVIMEGIQKTQQMSSSALNFIPHKSPRSGRESLRSTPRTNFSPRSMVESSLGDETPLYDEG